MLRTENLQIRRDQKVVLADVTLDVRPGEVLVDAGHNGGAVERYQIFHLPALFVARIRSWVMAVG